MAVAHLLDEPKAAPDHGKAELDRHELDRHELDRPSWKRCRSCASLVAVVATASVAEGMTNLTASCSAERRKGKAA